MTSGSRLTAAPRPVGCHLRSTKRMFLMVAALSVCFCTRASQAWSAVIHVPGDYPTIQEAINAAAPTGDEIIVAPGTYNEAISYTGKDIYLHSSDGPEVTALDGAGLETSVVSFVNGETMDSRLEGFTITNGWGTWGEYAGNQELLGGGVYLLDSAATITNCRLAGNRTDRQVYGIALAAVNSDVAMDGCVISYNRCVRRCSVVWFDSSNVTMSDCSVHHNTMRTGIVTYDQALVRFSSACVAVVRNTQFSDNSGGSAIRFNGENVDVSDCVFERNVAHDAPACGLAGGVIHDCRFVHNVSETQAGALSLTGYDAVLRNCVFEDNRAPRGGAVVVNGYHHFYNCVFRANLANYGGALYAERAGSNLTHCLIIDNVGQDAAPAAYAKAGAGLRFYACLFTRNNAGSGGLFENELENTVIISNSILQFNTPLNLSPDNIQIVEYCNIGGGHPGDGNIDADPLFINPMHGDFRLSSGSPCIDAGSNSLLPRDDYDLDGDGRLDEIIPYDYLGNRRTMDDTAIVDTGEGFPPQVDIGPFEFQRTSKCALQVIGTPLVGNEMADFVYSNGRPDDLCWFLWSTGPQGETYIPQLDVTVQLLQPLLVGGPTRTNQRGRAHLSRRMPAVLQEQDVRFQAVQHGVASNVVSTRITPQ